MYCPKCGAEIPTDARYCRTCGSDVSLVPMALTGTLPAKPKAPAGTPERADAERLSKAIVNSMTGLGFLLVAPLVLVFMPGGHVWWFFMLIPAFATMGAGLADFIRYRMSVKASLPPAADYEQPELPPAHGFTNSLPPSSVTETTTRNLENARERQRETP